MSVPSPWGDITQEKFDTHIAKMIAEYERAEAITERLQEAADKVQDMADDAERSQPDRESIDAEISDIRDDHGDNTPEGPWMTDRLRVSYQKDAARLASLHAAPLPGPCYAVVCDGCGAKPESDEFGDRLHFSDQYPFGAADHDWREVSGLHFCDECSGRMVCLECSGLSGDGAKDRDGMCPDCWDADQREPGVGQESLPVVSS